MNTPILRIKVPKKRLVELESSRIDVPVVNHAPMIEHAQVVDNVPVGYII